MAGGEGEPEVAGNSGYRSSLGKHRKRKPLGDSLKTGQVLRPHASHHPTSPACFFLCPAFTETHFVAPSTNSGV